MHARMHACMYACIFFMRGSIEIWVLVNMYIHICICTSVCVCSSVCLAHKGRDYGCLMVVPGRDDVVVVFCEAGFSGWRWPRLHGLRRAMGLRVTPIPSCLQFSS